MGWTQKCKHSETMSVAPDFTQAQVKHNK